MDALESQAREARGRLEDLAKGSRRDRVASVAHAFSALLSVAPVNAGIAFLPLVLVVPALVVVFLMPVLIFGVSVVLLTSVTENSAALNWSLLGTTSGAVFLLILVSDIAKGLMSVVAWWLGLHFKFLLGDS